MKYIQALSVTISIVFLTLVIREIANLSTIHTILLGIGIGGPIIIFLEIIQEINEK